MTKSDYEKNSITLPGAVAMGTGVMIGAGIFALTGQIAELAGPLFPLSFVVGAIVTSFSAYTYIDVERVSVTGGIGMILKKAYGPTSVAAGAALLMALSMVINESLVARTFGTYTLRAFGGDPDSVLVPVLGVGLIVFAYLVNASGTRSVGLFSIVMAVLKVGGIALFGVAGLWASGISFEATGGDFGATGFVASVALSILAFKGFTTITNSGAEVTDPAPQCGPGHHLVHRALRCCLSAGRLRGRLQPAARSHRRGKGLCAGRGCPARPRADRFLPDRGAGGHGVGSDRQRVRGVADAGDADRHEDDPAQPFRDAGHDQRPHACLHCGDCGLSDGVLRPQPHRLARGVLLSGDGHDHSLRRVPPPARGDRREGLGLADGHRL